MQRYLKAGGLLLADACCGRMAFDLAFRREIAKVLPRAQAGEAARRTIRCTTATTTSGRWTTRRGCARISARSTTPELEGITLDGRLAVIYSRFDLGNGWEQFPHAYSYGLKDESALQIGTNVLVYAITH